MVDAHECEGVESGGEPAEPGDVVWPGSCDAGVVSAGAKEHALSQAWAAGAEARGGASTDEQRVDDRANCQGDADQHGVGAVDDAVYSQGGGCEEPGRAGGEAGLAA